jgi:hypothetical protein
MIQWLTLQLLAFGLTPPGVKKLEPQRYKIRDVSTSTPFNEQLLVAIDLCEKSISCWRRQYKSLQMFAVDFL